MPPSYLDSIGGASEANDTPPPSPSSTTSSATVDTRVTRDGDKTIITIKSVSTVRIKKE